MPFLAFSLSRVYPAWHHLSSLPVPAGKGKAGRQAAWAAVDSTRFGYQRCRLAVAVPRAIGTGNSSSATYEQAGIASAKTARRTKQDTYLRNVRPQTQILTEIQAVF